MRKAVLLRVGIDSGCGGIQGPLFSDGSFEFVCIPDNKRVSAHKYGTVIGKNGRPHSAYFPARKQVVVARKAVEGLVARNAEGVWHVRRQGVDSEKPAKVGGGSFRRDGNQVCDHTEIGMNMASIFSTYTTGENRVTASFLGVLRALSLDRMQRLLGSLME